MLQGGARKARYGFLCPLGLLNTVRSSGVRCVEIGWVELGIGLALASRGMVRSGAS
jgi:hypothetical protein